jgi:alpha-glucosidase
LKVTAWRHGGFQILYASDETLAFMREALEERQIVVARRAPEGLRAIPVRHGGLSDGIVLQEVFSGAETVVDSGILSLSNLPDAGIQVWRSTRPGLYEI